MKIFNGDVHVIDESNQMFEQVGMIGVAITNYSTKLFKENEKLIELPNDVFVSVSDVKSKSDLLKLYLIANQTDAIGQAIFGWDNRLIFEESEMKPCKDNRFVYKDSLKEIPKKESRKILFKI